MDTNAWVNLWAKATDLKVSSIDAADLVASIRGRGCDQTVALAAVLYLGVTRELVLENPNRPIGGWLGVALQAAEAVVEKRVFNSLCVKETAHVRMLGKVVAKASLYTST